MDKIIDKIRNIGCEKMIKKIKNNKVLVIISLLLLIVIVMITKKIALKEELIIDKLAYDILVTKLRNPILTSFMKLVTKLSNTVFVASAILILIIVFYYILKKKKIAYLLAGNLMFIVLLNQIIKFMIRRDRPIGFRLIEETGYSFPSGHAMVSMAFYGLLIYIIKHLIKNKKLRIFLITLNVAIILLIGISRVYLGVHYLSDVVTGYSISLIYLLVLTKYLNKYHVIP